MTSTQNIMKRWSRLNALFNNLVYPKKLFLNPLFLIGLQINRAVEKLLEKIFYTFKITARWSRSLWNLFALINSKIFKKYFKGSKDTTLKLSPLWHDPNVGLSTRQLWMCGKPNLIKFCKYSTTSGFYNQKKNYHDNFFYLQKIIERNKDGHNKYHRLINILWDPKILKTAYHMLKLNSNSKTLVIKNEIVDDKWFKNTSKQLKNHTFKFNRVKQKTILKSNEQNKHLRIINLKYKIIEQALKIILKFIFKSQFSNFSNNFKTQKNYHMILNQIKKNWIGISWFLEFNIRKCYEEMDKLTLMKILKEKINDEQFIDVIYELLDIKMQNSLKRINKKDVSRNAIISPLICDIYLRKLDIHVEELLKQEKLNRKKHNRADNNFINIIDLLHTKKCKNLFKDKKIILINQKIKLTKWINFARTNCNNNTFWRIHYLRFDDNLLLGVALRRGHVDSDV